MYEQIRSLETKANLVWIGFICWPIGLVFLILTISGANTHLDNPDATLSDEERTQLLKVKSNAIRNFILILVIPIAVGFLAIGCAFLAASQY